MAENDITLLPDPLLEHLFTYLNPYHDLDNARLVCKRWDKIVKRAIAHMKRHFNRCSEFSWYLIDEKYGSPLRERCSHSSCYYECEQVMYLFGGCTAAHAAFNDLWKFDLINREWERVIPNSILPQARALASFVVYQNNLILYGGFTKSSINPIHQTTTFFGDVFLFSISKRRWESFITNTPGPLLAGHTVAIVGHCMLVFGGSTGNSCNNTVFILDLNQRIWHEIILSPPPRYGQSMIKLDDSNFVIIGGCAGPGMILNDVWLLQVDFNKMTGEWMQLKIENPELTPSNVWCHSACKVGTNAVLFGKPIHQGLIRRRRSRSNNSSPKRRISSPDSPQDRQAVAAFVNSRLQNSIKSEGPEVDGENEGCSSKRKPFLSSKSLDEHEPKSIPGSQSKPSLLTSISSRGSELHRTCSIPAIIVGEIPKLIVTSTENVCPTEKKDETKAMNSVKMDSFDEDVPDSATSSGYSSSSIPSAHDSAEHVGTSSSLDNVARQYYLSVLAEERQKLNGLEKLGNSDLVRKKLEDLLKGRLSEKERASILDEFFSTWETASSSNKKKPPRDTGQLNRVRPKLSAPLIENPPTTSKVEDMNGRNLRNALCVYVLRLSNCIREKTVRWEQLPMDDDSPDDTILYSIVAGRGEIIMVGGVRKDADGNDSEVLNVSYSKTITNETFIVRPRYSDLY